MHLAGRSMRQDGFKYQDDCLATNPFRHPARVHHLSEDRYRVEGTYDPLWGKACPLLGHSRRASLKRNLFASGPDDRATASAMRPSKHLLLGCVHWQTYLLGGRLG